MRRLIPLLTVLMLVLTACGSPGTATTTEGTPADETSSRAEATDLTEETLPAEETLPTEETTADLAEETLPAEETVPAEEATADLAGDMPLLKDDDFETTFTNFSTEIHIDTDGMKMILTYKVHPEGMFFATGDESGLMVSMLFNPADNKVYMLDSATKTAMSFSSDTLNNEDMQDPAEFFVPWDDDEMAGLTRGAAETFDGRKVTAYSYDEGGFKGTYLIDEELGLCIAATWESEGMTGSWEMHNLEFGQVTADDVKVPADYTITDLSDLEDMYNDFDDDFDDDDD